jgi:capsular exopolysaccharide synthesis family protein
MTRLYDALRRAAENGDAPASASADDLAQFATEENSAGPASPAGDGDTTDWRTDDAFGRAPEVMAARSTGQTSVELQPNLTAEVPSTLAPTAQAAVVRQHTDGEIAISDVVRRLGRRWKLVAAVVVAFLSIAAVYNVRATRFFEARTRVLVDPDSPQVAPFRQLTEDTTRTDYFVTQVEVLHSRDVARKTLEKLHLLGEDARQQASQIDLLLASLTVTPIRSEMGGSRVINVAITSTDAYSAAQFANGVAQTYVEQNLEARRKGSREATAWLTDRLSELRGQVNTREGALQQYREQKDAVSLDERQNIVVQKLAQLNQAVTAARTERIEKEALYQQLVAIQERGVPVDTFPAIIANSFIQGLKAELASLQRERAQLSEQLGDLHPDMIKVNTAIDAAQRRLNAEMAKVIEGVKNDYIAAQAREKGLLAALDDQKREVLNLNQKAIGYTALQRDASSTQQIFESVLQRVKETELSGQLQSNNVRVLDFAEVPRSAVWPRQQLNLFVALVGGLFLGVALVIGLEYLDPRIAHPDDIKDALGLPMLGVAPRLSALNNGPLTDDKLPPEFHEALRGIRTRILLSPIATSARSIAVTSAMPGEGKTMLASGLAISLAKAGRRVLLIDADMRRAQMHRIFDVARSPGLSNILAGDVKAPAVICESTGVEGLSILPAGDELPMLSEPLDSESVAALLQGFSERFDLIVLDCPPVMAVADASIIAHAVSSVMLVVGAGTSREVAQAAAERLTSVHARIVGAVLNKAESYRGSPYYYHYYHQSART